MAALQGAVMLGGMSYFMDSLQTREAEARTVLPVRPSLGQQRVPFVASPLASRPLPAMHFLISLSGNGRAARTHKGATPALHPVRKRMK